jgi:hypothetical protein
MNKPTISQKALNLLRRKAREALPAPTPARRDNIFSQSRDVREDRDTRQMKTTRHQSQMLPPVL